MNALSNDAMPQSAPFGVRVYADAEQAAVATAELFINAGNAAIAHQGRFRVALSGGSTPRRTYELLAAPERAGRIDWSNVEIFWGDERYVSADDPQSNYHMAREALLQRVPIPAANVYRVQTELNPPEAAAAAYEAAIRQAFGMSAGVPRFDMQLLGLGTNGHTASLFPHLPVLHESDRLVAAAYVAEVGMWRITMTVPLLNAARTVAFQVSGKDKAEVLREVLCGSPDPDRLPAQLIHPAEGVLLWIVDEAAAAALPR